MWAWLFLAVSFVLSSRGADGSDLFIDYREAIKVVANRNSSDEATEIIYFLMDRSTKGFNEVQPHFKWRQCGSPLTDPVSIQSLAILPDPIQLPGKLDIYLKTKIGTDLSAPIELDLAMEFHMGVFWAHVPCRNNIGSCKYDDVCSMIEIPPEEPCPSAFNSSNVPCRCPIPADKYKLNKATIDLNVDPSGVPAGSYFVKANMFSKSRRLGCLELYFDIGH